VLLGKIGPTGALPSEARVLERHASHHKELRMLSRKKAIRRAWTSSDLREMKSLARKKVGVMKISKALKRTIGATAVKAHQLGISLSTRD
jgi:hypothetical protein